MIHDAVIAGARIAGSTTALLLAQRGYSVLLLDRDRFPSPVMSTHLFFTDTMDVLERTGVLDRVLAVDAPRLARLRFPYVDAPFAPVHGRDFALCVRRETLDALLVEAAGAHPNVELRTGTRVTGLVRDGERVAGVRFRRAAARREEEARGRIVIGADGRHSLVAREVGAATYDAVPPIFAWYYAYFRDMPLDDPPSAFAARGALPEVGSDYGASFVFPTDGGQTVVGFGVQRDAFDRFRVRHREHFFLGLERIPPVAARLAGARLVGQIVGTGDLENFLRVPAGPGWALVGDAGSHKDPHTAQGMGDAARAAVLLAEALDAWWRGDLDEAAALARYQRARDADLLPMYDFTTGRLEARLAPEEWEAFGRRTGEDPALARARVAAMAHANPPGEVYSVEAVRGWLAR
ncbi:MAG TPA: NAD(P)/FAD-dependent oxidoreductase [Thermomicrobiaceae bacterium]|nr:NAD(P)/FAD-dependent oxidoreductase [Thermomicrobiaceae bacterium]